MKNIIPAIASTNALISAACVNEAVKIVTHSSYLLDNFMQYNGVNLQGCILHRYVKKLECSACSHPKFLHADSKTTLGKLRERLESELKLQEPSIFLEDKTLYLRTQHEHFRDQLDKTIDTLFNSKDQIRVSDVAKRTVQIVVIFEYGA